MKLQALCTAVLATTAFADLFTVNSVKHILEVVTKYHQSLTDFDGSYTSGVKFWKTSSDLVKTLKAIHYNPQAKVHVRLTEEEDEQLEQEGFDVTYSLLKMIQSCVDVGISKKEKISSLPLGTRIARMNLKNMQDASSRLTILFGPKASEGRQKESQELVKKINDELHRGVVAYGGS